MIQGFSNLLFVQINGAKLIRIVCFDIGGVLSLITPTWNLARSAAGFSIAPEFEIGIESFEPIRAYQQGTISEDSYLQELSNFLCLSVSDSLTVHQSILLGPTPGTLEIIQKLNQSQIVTTACLSNTSELHWRVLCNPDIYPNVYALKLKFASHLMGEHKPDLRIFRHFEKTTGMNADEILFFEDAPRNIAGAVKAGWTVFPIDPSKPASPQILEGLDLYKVKL